MAVAYWNHCIINFLGVLSSNIIYICDKIQPHDKTQRYLQNTKWTLVLASFHRCDHFHIIKSWLESWHHRSRGVFSKAAQLSTRHSCVCCSRLVQSVSRRCDQPVHVHARQNLWPVLTSPVHACTVAPLSKPQLDHVTWSRRVVVWACVPRHAKHI